MDDLYPQYDYLPVTDEKRDRAPESIRDEPSWLCYRIEATSEGTITEVPKAPTPPLGIVDIRSVTPHSTSDALTYEETLDFAVWAEQLHGGLFDGVGLMLSSGNLVCVEIAGCVDPDTGEIGSEALEILDVLDSYTEYTAPQTGLRIFARGSLDPTIDDPPGDVRFHDEWFTPFTGKHVDGFASDVHDRRDDLHEMQERFEKMNRS